MDESKEAIAGRLKALFAKQSLAQGLFSKRYGLGSQGNVGHYLHARRPLSLDAALRFIKGLREEGVKVQLEDISKALAEEQKKLAAGLPPQPARKLANKDNPAWAGPQSKGQRELADVVQRYAHFLTDKQCHHIAEIIKGSVGTPDPETPPLPVHSGQVTKPVMLTKEQKAGLRKWKKDALFS